MVLENAREKCANLLHAKVEEIIFCSGATEADNLAIRGTLSHADTAHQHLVSSEQEHAAVYETVNRQAQTGRSVSWLPIDSQGLVDLDALKRTLEKHPQSLVSVMVVNNEVGTRQPVREIGQICRQYGALFHCDGVQDPKTCQSLISDGLVDLVAFSGHKLGGIHGGLLYVRQGVAVNPQIVGGAQEDGRRAGTNEVLRAESLSLALEASLSEAGPQQARDQFEKVLGELPQSVRLGPSSARDRGHHISSWLFGELAAEPVLVQLDLKGICASSGSACSSHSVEPSRVVKAMGYSEKQASGLLRFSFGWKTELSEVQKAADLVKEVVTKMMNKEKVSR